MKQTAKDPWRPGPTTIESIDTDYDDRPEHRGHHVEIQGWNSQYVMLVIHSDGKSNEALISPDELMTLAKAAKKDVHRW